MKIGQCYQCGKKIGGKTANGVFRYDLRLFRQAVLEYDVGRGNKTTQVHVPVCVTCLEGLDTATIEKNIGNDKNFKAFKKSCPKAKAKGIKEERLPTTL